MTRYMRAQLYQLSRKISNEQGYHDVLHARAVVPAAIQNQQEANLLQALQLMETSIEQDHVLRSWQGSHNDIEVP